MGWCHRVKADGIASRGRYVYHAVLGTTMGVEKGSIQGSLCFSFLFLVWAPSSGFALEAASHFSAHLTRLERPGRSLGQTVVPDCGRAFQPCCSVGDVCTDPGLSCIGREPQPRCEPCGAPFAQPCPISPYCEAGGLIPTTRAISELLILQSMPN